MEMLWACLVHDVFTQAGAEKTNRNKFYNFFFFPESLETTAVVQTIKTRTRSAINETLREALQQNRVKRARRSDTTQVHRIMPVMFDKARR